jgi:protein-disulfide isomerase
MSKLKPAVNAADHHEGNINASIILVEYGDFQCPYCGRAYPLIKRLLKERGKDIHFVFRNFPLSEIHVHAFAAALAAEAAGKQGKFWEMHDLIFENQDLLDDDFLLSSAQFLGLDMKQFKMDSKSEELQNKIDSDFDSGVRSGVNGTPSFFLNNAKLLTYDETYKSLLDAVQSESKMNSR